MTADIQDGDPFRRSMAELSRRLAERVRPLSATEARAAAEARRATLEAQDRARLRWLVVLLGAPVAAAAGMAAAWLVQSLDVSDPPLASVASAAERQQPPPPPLSTVTVAPASAPIEAPLPEPEPSPPSLSAASASAPAAGTPATAPAMPAAASPAPPAPQPERASEAPLPRDEMREVQARLRAFGFDPGPVDGVAGRLTEAAVRRYQENRVQPQTGRIDLQLLEQLRRDPAPPAARQVAQRAPEPPAYPAAARPQRRSDPFEPLRSAGERFGRWLESLGR